MRIIPKIEEGVEYKVFNILTENRKGKNINLAIKYFIEETGSSRKEGEEFVSSIQSDIPNSNMKDCFYMLGLMRMALNNQIDNTNRANLNKTLKYLKGHSDYSQDLNGLSADELIDRFEVNIKQDSEQDRIISAQKQRIPNKRYKVVPIRDGKEAAQYANDVDWCVCTGSYYNYTDNGKGIFYFILRDDYKGLEAPDEKPDNAPFDDYGLSMVAVSVDMFGDLNTCTSRWNHDHGFKDDIMNTDQIGDLIGKDFYSVFLPRPMEEILSKMNFEADGLCIQKKGNNYGLIKQNFEWELYPEYSNISKLSNDGYREVIKNNKCGIINQNLEWLLKPTKYNGIEKMNYDGYILVYVYYRNYDKMFGLINSKFEEVLPPKYARIDKLESDGCRQVKAIGEYGKWGLINSKFEEVLPPKYTQIGGLRNDGYRTVMIYNPISNKCGLIKLINSKFEEVLPPKYEQIRELESDGCTSVSVYDYNKNNDSFERTFGLIKLINSKFEEVLPPKYSNIGKLEQHDGCRIVMSGTPPNETYGLINSNFEEVLDTEYNKIRDLEFDPQFGICRQVTKKRCIGYYILNKNQIIWSDERKSNFNLSESIIPSQINLNSFENKGCLNPKVFDENEKIFKKLRLRLIDVADDFIDELNIPGVDPLDIVLVGSMAGYSWSKYSDFDIHIIYRFSEIDKRVDLVRDYFDSKKKIWNDEKQIKIYGYPVELYVESEEDPSESNGRYSLYNNSWIKFPEHPEPITYQKAFIKEKSANLINLIDNYDEKFNYYVNVEDDETLMLLYKKCNSLWTRIKGMRKFGIARGSEDDPYNIIFKILRRCNRLEKLVDLKNKLYIYNKSIR